jgi:hypothetical protein
VQFAFAAVCGVYLQATGGLLRQTSIVGCLLEYPQVRSTVGWLYRAVFRLCLGTAASPFQAVSDFVHG